MEEFYKIPGELVELALGGPPTVGQELNLNQIFNDKTVHSMTVTEVHEEERMLTVNAYAVNQKIYSIKLPMEFFEKRSVN